MNRALTNWAGNVTFGAARYHEPASVPELQQIVAAARQVRALGTGHSFNRIADTAGDLVSVAALPRIIELDPDTATVRVSGGVRYGDLAVRVNEAGFALRNLGSLPHISVAGACATGTHGSGDANQILPASVSAVEVVTADGELVTVSRESDPDDFGGWVLALGSLGIVASLTLDLQPAFLMRQDIYDGVPQERLLDQLDEIFASAYSVSLFTDWQRPGRYQTWFKLRAEVGDTTPPAPTRFGGTAADSGRHPIPQLTGEDATQQLGVVGPWHERLPHFRPEFTPSKGDELQSEYLFPREHAAEAINALSEMGSLLAPILLVSEIRTIAADGLWLSPAYHQDSMAFHFTWIRDLEAVTPVLVEIERVLAPFGARPHWGKVFVAGPEQVSPLYQRYHDFQRLLARQDPSGKFRNELIDRYFAVPG